MYGLHRVAKCCQEMSLSLWHKKQNPENPAKECVITDMHSVTRGRRAELWERCVNMKNVCSVQTERERSAAAGNETDIYINLT